MAEVSLAPSAPTVPAAIRDRALRGLKLFSERGSEIDPKPGGGLSVPSASTPGRSYRVSLAGEGRCGCPDFLKRRRVCLHIYAARVFAAKHGA